MSTLNEILDQARALPESERMALARSLLALDEPQSSAAAELAWDAEIRKRIARFDAGRETSRPSDDVFADIESRLPRER